MAGCRRREVADAHEAPKRKFIRKELREMQPQLSRDECDTLLKLYQKGPGGSFEQISLGRLFALNLIEFSSNARCIVLTDAGRRIRDELQSGQCERPAIRECQAGDR